MIALIVTGLAVAGEVQADLHLDTLTQLHRKGLGFDAPSGLEAGIAQLRAGGTNVAVLALWPPRESDWRAHTLALLDRFDKEDARLEELELARSPADARRIAGEGKIAAVLSLEGAHGLGEDWRATLDLLHARGLSMLGLTWSFSNRFAGSSGDGGGGLTDDGRALVARARELGIVIDLSHASRKTTMDVCTGSPVPVVASHSNAFGVHAAPRNLTDEEIKCIAGTGGVIGLNFHATFVGPDAGAMAIARHAVHVASVGGFGAVALGSDYDGLIKVPLGMENASSVPHVWDALVKFNGWTMEQIRGARGENFLRAWGRVGGKGQESGK